MTYGITATEAAAILRENERLLDELSQAVWPPAPSPMCACGHRTLTHRGGADWCEWVQESPDEAYEECSCGHFERQDDRP